MNSGASEVRCTRAPLPQTVQGVRACGDFPDVNCLGAMTAPRRPTNVPSLIYMIGLCPKGLPRLALEINIPIADQGTSIGDNR